MRPAAAAADSSRALLRLPNAPELFEGRDRELRWLGDRFAAKKASIVWSPPGLGKTGLALRAAAGTGDVRGVHVSVTDHATEAAFLGALHDALALAMGEAAPTPRRVATGERVAAIVARLDRVGLPVLLEDLHGLPEATAESLLVGIGHHCRAVALIATTRRRPKHDDLAERTLRLEPLADEAVARIASRLRPDFPRERIAEIVASAGGSPRLARQNALGLDARRSVLDGVAAGPSALVRTLAEIEGPVDVASGPDRDREIADLIDGGFVERTAEGVRVVDSLRHLVRAATRDRTASRRDALGMAIADGRPRACFEVVRLALELGDRPVAEETLAAHEITLLHLGYGDALFELLRASDPPLSAALRATCLAIADWLRGGASLRWTCEQAEPASPRERLIWCRLLALGGRIADAEERAAHLAVDGSDPALRVEASSLHADIVGWSGRATRAVALLDAIDAPRGRLSVDRDLRLIVALVRAGDASRASVVARTTMDEYDRLEPSERLALRDGLLSALLAASSFRGLERLLGTSDPAPGAPTSELFAALAMATERGHVGLARRLLAMARVAEGTTVALRFAAGYNDLRLRTVFGPFDDLAHEGRRAVARVEPSGVGDFVAYLYAAQAAAAITVGEIDDTPPLPAGMGEGEGSALLARAWHAVTRIRRGAAVEPATSTGTNAFEVELAVSRWQVERLVATGALADAARHVERVLQRLHAEGLVLDELAWSSLRVDVALLGGAPLAADAERHVDDLRALAASVGSRRFELEADLARWSLSSPRRAEVLLALADDIEAPVASRRARALLARPSTLDALDVRVVDAIATRRGLLLDVARKCVELPTGRRVDLGGSSLHVKLLEAFFRSGGTASKEALARIVWDRTAYHPHRDDKRIQVAIHRLRHAIEDDPANPRIVVRVGDDYRVTSDIALRRL